MTKTRDRTPKDPFTPSRADGRSDRRVVFELVRDADPGTAYEYKVLIEALQEGLEEPVQRPRVYRAVAGANKTLLRERKRYLSVVPKVGYRVIAADEHLPVALGKKDRAQTYLRAGIELLKNARIEELSDTQRSLHEGQLMLLGGLYQAVNESARRHSRSEKLIADLRARVDRLEGDD